MAEQPLLEVRDLEKHYIQREGLLDPVLGREPDTVSAVDGVSLTLGQQETLGIIGESGCGKTTLLHTLMQLTEPTAGTIRFKGQDISTFSKQDWADFRKDISLIFQDPFNSLDPKLRVQESVREPLDIHGMDDREQRVIAALEEAELTPASDYLDKYPKHLSGGEKQRVSIARALVSEPDVIFADEPVSMLDVSTQAAVLNLLANIVETSELSMLYISHDLSTVSYVCQEINVMYLGRIVESGPTDELLSTPKHPYSDALISAIPVPDPHHDRPRTNMEGSPSTPINLGEGCRFRDRCPERMEICEKTPLNIDVDDDRQVACHLYYDHDDHRASQTTAAAADQTGSHTTQHTDNEERRESPSSQDGDR